MCELASVAEALALLGRALDALNAADAASLPTVTQAEVLKVLEVAQAKHTAARAKVLSVFAAQNGYVADGQGSARAWLAWQTQVTRAAAAGAVGWMKRLAAHPVIGQALAAGALSASWARQICEWTDRLPGEHRDAADGILAGAATAGAGLADLGRLAEELFASLAGPDRDSDDRSGDRYLHLGTTLGGAGRLTGDLTPACAAAVSAVLEALGARAGPEDTRTKGQRDHDALAEACRRLVAAGMVPGRAGQPTHIQVHMTLGQLRGEPGAREAEAAWAAQRAGQAGWLSGPEAAAAACDATIVPVVTGQVDPVALDRLTGAFLAASGHRGELDAAKPGPAPSPLPGHSPAIRQRLQAALLGLAASALSGPGGLAATLRARAGGPVASVSLPLDVGAATSTIPAHLRRAVTTRDRGCRFPGCAQPASVCEIHHLIPRSGGGPTRLSNLVLLCAFHHLTAVHAWGWQLTLRPDGTTTATSPGRDRVYHSHGPPGQAA